MIEETHTMARSKITGRNGHGHKNNFTVLMKKSSITFSKKKKTQVKRLGF
jgi:hypothetical protein